MPTTTYDLITSTVLGSGAGSVTFTSIPQTYRDLVCVIESKAQGASYFTLNSSGGFVVDMAGGNGATASGSRTQSSFNIQNYNNGHHQTIIEILDYSSTTKHKSGLCRVNVIGGSPFPASYTYAAFTRYASNTAVTSMDIIAQVNNYVAGDTFYLYGIVG